MGTTVQGREPLEAPDLPDEHKCERCGKAVYRVTSCDGEEIELDIEPLEVAEDLFGGWVRDGHDGPDKYVGGYRIDDPMYFAGLAATYGGDAMEPPGWRWYATRRPLRDAADPAVELHSAHLMSCAAISPRQRSAIICQRRQTTENAIGELAQRVRARNLAAARAQYGGVSPKVAQPESPRRPNQEAARHSLPPLPSELGRVATEQEQLSLL